MFSTFLIVLHITVAMALIVIVLFQHGSKGASMGSAFGGSSQTLFGSRGPATALAKITTVAAVIFMITSITLSIVSRGALEESVVSDAPDTINLPVTLPEQEQPAAPGPVGPMGEAQSPPESAPAAPVGPVDPNQPEAPSGQ